MDLARANRRTKESFLNELISELAHTLQNVVGTAEAEGFVKIVGLRMGKVIHADYAAYFGKQEWTVEQLAEVLVDLKRRINGGFRIERIDGERIVLRNDKCPFGRMVEGRESLCQMTSSVFGKVASESFGHARVKIERSIARGDGFCEVVVELSPAEPGQPGAVEFYKT